MKTKFRVIVVDDERLSRHELIRILSRFDSFNVVGEAFDVPSAITLIEKSVPDIIFLDIQMPKQSGFELIKQVKTYAKIVFVTAFENYAINAFDINAFDYIVKPVSEERIKKLLDKINRNTSEESSHNKLSYDDKIFVSDNKFLKFIAIKDITMIQSTGNYSNVYLKESENILICKSLKEWLSKLPANKFCRIHRTTIINIDYIERIERWVNCSFKVYIANIETPVMMSKRYSFIVRKQFS